MDSAKKIGLGWWLLIAALAAVGFAWAFNARGANNLYEFCHYADIARNWAGGQGFSTNISEPGILALLEHRNLPTDFPLPVVYRFWLYAALVTASVGLLGFSDLAVCLVNALIHIAIALSILFIGRRLFDRQAALAAALVYVLHPVFAGRYMISGFAGPTFCLILLWLHFLLIREREWSLNTALAAGVLTGLAYLARYNIILFLPIYLALVFYRTGWRGRLLFGVSAALVCTPLWYFNLKHFGTISPYPSLAMNLAAGTVAGDADPWRLYRIFELKPILTDYWSQVATKGLVNFFAVFIPGIFWVWRLPLLVLLFAWNAIRKSEGAGRRLLWLGGALVIWQGIVFSPLRLELLDIPNAYYRGRYFFWFVPLLLLGGFGGLSALISQGPYRRWLLSGFVIATLALAWSGFKPGGYHFDPKSDQSASIFESLDPESTFLVSNMAFPAGAYFRLRTLDLPDSPEELARMTARYRPTHLFLHRRYYLTDSWRKLLHDTELQKKFFQQTGFTPQRALYSQTDEFVGVLFIRSGG